MFDWLLITPLLAFIRILHSSLLFLLLYVVLYFTFSLREKCTNTKYFLVCIFPYSDVKGVNLLIQSEYGNIRTRKNSVSEHFSRSVSVVLFFFISLKIPRSKLKHKITMAYEVIPYLLPHQ